MVLEEFYERKRGGDAIRVKRPRKKRQFSKCATRASR